MNPGPPDDAEAGFPRTERSSSHLGSRVAVSAGLLWLLSMLVRSISVLSMLVLARLLSPLDFGLVALAMAAVGGIEVVTNIQAGAAIIKTEKPDKSYFDTAFTLNLLRGLFSAAVLGVAAVPLASFMESPELASVLFVLIIPTLLLALSNPYFILYARSLDFRFETRRKAIAAVAGALVSIAIAVAFRTYWALVAATIVQSVVMVSLSYWRVPGRPSLSLARWRELFGFGSWLLLQNLVQYVGLKFDYFFIGKVLDPATLGAYHLGNQVNNMASADIVPTLSRALFPAFSTINTDPERLRRSYVMAQSVAVAIALPMGFGLALLAEPLIRLLLGPGWDLAVPVVQFMAPFLALQSLGSGVEGIAMALNRPRVLALRTTLYIIARTLLVVGGWFVGGFMGIIIGRALSGILYPAYNMALGASFTGGQMMDVVRAAWRSFAAVAIMSAGLLLLPALDVEQTPPLLLVAHLVGRAMLGAGLYAGAHLLLWRVQGRPVGAESRLLDQAGRAVSRLMRRPAG